MTKRSSDAAGIKSEPKLFSEICAAGLRKGKWTDEEGKYASTIIAHFESNLLPLTEQRESTIRLFLGKELHCDPMRISKKFAGNNSVGKHFFCKKQEDGQQQSADSLHRAKLEREQMRLAFLESVEKEFEAASKRPKRIRIRNRKKKPKVEEPVSFSWDGDFSDDDLGDLQTLLDDKVKEENVVVTPRPCDSPKHDVQQPLTPPSGPIPASFEHDKLTLDGGGHVGAPPPPAHVGAFVEPPRAFSVSLLGMAPPVVNMSYPAHFVVVCPMPQQGWACQLPQQLAFAAVPVHQAIKEDELDSRLEEILKCDDGTDDYDFLNTI